MTCTVILDNYNYGRYLVQAVESVLNQTYPDFDLVIVDDGSQDESSEVLKGYETRERLRVVAKENGGQLSAFQAALPYVTGELVFFLDADDWYDPAYLERAVRFYREHHDCDFLAVKRVLEGERTPNDRMLKKSVGFSVLRTYYLHQWLGGVTTMLSMRTTLLRNVLPIPDEASWRLRADDCLVMGASLAGAKKYFLPEPLVHYRLHGSNGMLVCVDNDHVYRRAIAVARLFAYVLEKNAIVPDHRMLLPEFRSVPDKELHDLADYLKVTLAMQLPLLLAMKYVFKLSAMYVREWYGAGKTEDIGDICA